MSGLSAALGAAARSLSAYSFGLAVTQENIANAATPSYARQRVSLAPIVLPGDGRGIGVEVQQVEALRSRLLELQVLVARQGLEQSSRKVQFFQQVEPNFRLTGNGSIGEAVDSLFASFSQLSTNPGDFNLRAAVLGAADGAVSAFRRVSANLLSEQTNLASEARTAVTRINGLLQEIRELQASRASGASGRPNAGADTRLHQLLNELSGLISFSFIQQQDGAFSLVTDGGSPLVAGNKSFPLAVSQTPTGVAVFDFQGNDITSTIEGRGGSLGAILEARNQDLPSLFQQVNRLAKTVADRVNEQLAEGVDLNGVPGQPLFDYARSLFVGSGRTPGTTGTATPSPPVSVDVTFSGGVAGSISAALDSFFVAGAPPAGAAAGDTVSITFTSAGGTIEKTITTAPLLGGEDAADLAIRLNDQIALDADLAGLITFSDAAGALKVVLSDEAGQGFTFTSETSNPGFTSGLEPGGSLGGHSAEEIAAALNAQVAADPALAAAGIRFSTQNGEVTLDGDVAFDFTVNDNDAAGTGFASGLGGVSGSAGGAVAASSLERAPLGLAEIAAGSPSAPSGNENALALAALAGAPVLDGLTFTDFYALTVTGLGSDSLNTQSQLATQEQVLVTAENIRDNLSGVDLNEEAVRLAEFERAFGAMLRVIEVIDQLSRDVIALGR